MTLARRLLGQEDCGNTVLLFSYNFDSFAKLLFESTYSKAVVAIARETVTNR